MREFYRSRLAAAVAAACLLAGPTPAVAQPAGPTAASNRAAIVSGLRENAVFAVLETYYPEVYKAALDALEQGMAKGQSVASMQNVIRDSYAALLAAQMPKAEGSYVLESIRIGQRQAEAVAAAPADCMAVLGFLKLQRAVQSVVPPDQIKAEQTWAAAMLRQTATKPVQRTIRPLSSDMLQSVAITAYDGLATDEARQRIARLGGKFAGVTDTEDQRAICEFSIQYTNALLALPTTEAVDVFLSITFAPAG